MQEKEAVGIPNQAASEDSVEEETHVEEEREDANDGDKDKDESNAEATLTRNLWKRLRNILLLIAVLWLVMIVVRSSGNRRSKVVYANRYSEEFKYRPAASPIITETLKDGRTRIRGAEPTARSAPQVQDEKPKSKKRRSGKQRQKRSKSRK